MTNDYSELAALFGYCNKPVEELIKPQPVTDPIKKEPEQEYFKIPDFATMDLGYCQTWHDLIDIHVPINKVPGALLMPRVPMPLHHRNPRSILSEWDRGWWDRTRKQVYSVQNQHCAVCGVHKMWQKSARKVIEAHELYSVDYRTGTVRLLGIIPVCKTCHSLIHFGRLTALHESGKVDDNQFYSMLNYGNQLLQNTGLPPKNWDAEVNDNRFQIPWEDWKLILEIEGKEYEFHSLYKDQADLEAHY